MHNEKYLLTSDQSLVGTERFDVPGGLEKYLRLNGLVPCCQILFTADLCFSGVAQVAIEQVKSILLTSHYGLK